MSNPKICSRCGKQLTSAAKFCPECGTSIKINGNNNTQVSDKSAVVTLLLCLFLGAFGIHRFYVGKIGTGILMLLTGGGFGIWTLVDLIRIACCDFTDSKGKYLVFTKGRSSPLKLILLIVGGFIITIFVYVILLILLVFHFTNPMTDVIQKQLAALREGNMNTAYSYMARETTKNVSLNDFKNYMSRFPEIPNNKSVSIPERKIENGNGYARVVIKTNDGKEMTIEYAMIKEGDTWKVLALRAGSISAENTSGPNIFNDPENRYSIQYPNGWSYAQRNKNFVVFNGKQGTSSSYSTVIIQIIPVKKANAKIALNVLKKQITSKTTNGQILSSGEVELPTNPQHIKGEYLIATYPYKGQQIKTMQFILSRDNGREFYFWVYSSVIDQYDKDLPSAKSMYESWQIK